MVKEYEQTLASGRFLVHDQVDVMDEKGTWMNGEVIEVAGTGVKIKFSGYSDKFNTWIDESSGKVLKQWKFGQEMQINNRVDILDTYNHWKEARIIDQNPEQIYITYRGYSKNYNEWIHKSSPRISIIGSKSNAYGIGKSDPSNNYRYSKKEVQVEGKKFDLAPNREKLFENILHLNQLKIIPVNGDGNCLFRSVSHQLYGDDSFHQLIRETAMHYISMERGYFSQFIIGGIEKIEDYITQMSRSGNWGDDLEIQAMSEIYDKAFNIFAYSSKPIRTFHEDQGTGRPIRLAYHGQSHYNSIVDEQGQGKMIETTPGEFEREFLTRAKSEEFKDSLLRYRVLFEENLREDIEEALRRSLEESQTEDFLLGQALEVSLKDNEDRELGMSEQELIQQAISLSRDEDEMLKHAIEISKKDVVPDAVVDVMNSGFTFEQAITAWHMCGDNTNAMIEYIFSEMT
jgi:OTU domain-containing protein 5